MEHSSASISDYLLQYTSSGTLTMGANGQTSPTQLSDQTLKSVSQRNYNTSQIIIGTTHQNVFLKVELQIFELFLSLLLC